MQINKLQLSGFKSFVDHTEVLIDAGLTGVVGPNGCGKSNLVEALRWVMGETSARQMRGGEMDDVIFSGTDKRPSRNLAEVSLTLNASNHGKPLILNGVNLSDESELVISRRITRGQGSNYRVNGKEIRARDVQLLFADAATGAHSPSLVSQGKIAALIQARPMERRVILEDASGISGLYSRRQEAESRLATADSNLLRVDDQVQNLETQLRNLAVQVRQAIKYRAIAAEIRLTEAMIVWFEWQGLQEQLATGTIKLQNLSHIVTQHTAQLAAATTIKTEFAAKIPAMRNGLELAAETVQQWRIKIGELESQTKNSNEKIILFKAQIEQIERDSTHEAELIADSAKELSRIEKMRQELREKSDLFGDQLTAAKAASAKSEENYRLTISATQASQLEVSSLEARHQDWNRRRRDIEQRRERTENEKRAVSQRLDSLPNYLNIESELQLLEAKFRETEALKQGYESRLEKAMLERVRLQPNEQTLQESKNEFDAIHARLLGEKDSLIKLMAQIAHSETKSKLQPETEKSASSKIVPLIAALSIPESLELALAAVLGDELLASHLPDSPSELAALDCRGWRRLDESVMVPLESKGEMELIGAALSSDFSGCDSVQSLASLIAIPKQLQPLLQSAIGAVGLVASAADGWKNWAKLTPGQRLVATTGQVWRWDGFYCASHDSSNNSLAILEAIKENNRANEQQRVMQQQLADLEQQIAVRLAIRPMFEQQLQDHRQQLHLVQQQEQAIQKEVQNCTVTLANQQQQINRLRLHITEAMVKRDSLNEQLARLESESQSLQQLVEKISAEPPLLDALEMARAAYSAKQSAAQLAQVQHDQNRAIEQTLARDAESRKERLQSLIVEAENWQNRQTVSTKRKSELASRLEAARVEIAKLELAIAAALGQRLTDAGALQTAEQNRQLVQDQLLIAEQEFAKSEFTLRQCEEKLNQSKELELRAQLAIEACHQQIETVKARSVEKFNCPVTALPRHLIKTMHRTTSTDAEPVAGENLDEFVGKSGAEIMAIIETEQFGGKLNEGDLANRLVRLVGDRDAIGAVNLLAERESAEITEELQKLLNEKSDLVAAIAKLRTAIGELNRDGRERLLAAFTEVNRHFARLFERLFGGGKAFLQLTTGDDPLEAGLDIFASPPGKKLQNLTLLSGGEQALTAIALIFAIFLTNPSPICVLDEVDAALDDANVDRFCSLLAEIADTSGTRFLVITHHRLTMARMDRLYGVTMAERGISQLVSVDLSETASRLTPAANNNSYRQSA